jgi:hypothetical protein
MWGQWFGTLLYPTILFVIGLYATLNPSRTKELLGIPGRGLNRAALKYYEQELATLEGLHANSYNLLLWLAWNVLDVMTYVFWFSIAYTLVFVGLFLTFAKMHGTSFGGGFVALASGGVLGRARSMRDTMKSLYDYDKKTEKLKKLIASIKSKL